MRLTKHQRRELEHLLTQHQTTLQRHLQESEHQATQLAAAARQAAERHQSYCIQANAEAARLTGQVEAMQALLAEAAAAPAA